MYQSYHHNKSNQVVYLVLLFVADKEWNVSSIHCILELLAAVKENILSRMCSRYFPSPAPSSYPQTVALPQHNLFLFPPHKVCIPNLLALIMEMYIVKNL